MHTTNLLSFLATATLAAAQCDRSVLENATSQYIAAQQAGSLTPFTALSPTVNYTENQRTTKTVSTGILSQPLVLAHNRSTYDTTQCAAFTELIITTASHPYVTGAQMRLTNNQVTQLDTIVTDAGDWLFNATGTYYWASRESWATIPEADRDSRETIQAAGDAYLDLFNNASVVVPWGTPCDRLEGGSYTGTGSDSDSCNVGVPSGVQLVDRRYVVDETLGTVDVMMNFGGGTQGLPDSHEFRVEKGRIRYVHTMSVQGA